MLKNRQISRVCRKRRKVTQKAVLSYLYVHDSDEVGTLIAQTLAGGASTTWGQSAKYVHLPTASGPMPVAAIYGTKHYAVQSDHLNTPRRLIQSDGQVAWQWAYSAFGDEQPTIASNRFANTALSQSFGTTTVPAVTFNLRYPGQYFDQESNLHYNYHRSLDAKTGRYSQSDPIDLQGGWNRFAYAEGNPLSNTDPTGLFVPGAHNSMSYIAAKGTCLQSRASELGNLTGGVDGLPGSQDPANAFIHSMCSPGEEPASCAAKTKKYVDEQLKQCTIPALAKALHAVQDSFAPGHMHGAQWHGMPWEKNGESWWNSIKHFAGDLMPGWTGAAAATKQTIQRYCDECGDCKK
jgi:RHS repeat-associated protein